MKKTLLSISLLIVTLSSFSQERKAFIGLGFGGAIPLGAFSETSGSYNTAGYAKTGASFNLNFHYKLNDMFGLAISSTGAANNMDVDKFITSISPNSGISGTVNKVSSVGCFLIGGYIKKSSFPLYAKVQIGYGNVQTAEVTLADNTSSITLKQSDKTYGFAYNIGVGAFLPLGNRFAFTASIDYTSCLAKPSVTVINTYTNTTLSSSPTFDYGQNYISTQIGIGYMFN